MSSPRTPTVVASPSSESIALSMPAWHVMHMSTLGEVANTMSSWMSARTTFSMRIEGLMMSAIGQVAPLVALDLGALRVRLGAGLLDLGEDLVPAGLEPSRARSECRPGTPVAAALRHEGLDALVARP